VSNLPSGVIDYGGFDDVSVTTLDVPYNWETLDDAITYLRDASYRALIGDQPEAVQKAAWAKVRTVLGRFATQQATLFSHPRFTSLAGASQNDRVPGRTEDRPLP
jgi:hypothetical protein